MLMRMVLFLSALIAAAYIPATSAHGYLKTPRSRNLVAYQDKNWNSYLSGNGQSNDPKPEDCPHCLNRGGTLAQCGLLTGMVDGIPWERNYDQPLTSWGKPMKPNIQGTYVEGDVIEVEVMATTHHKGHFEFAVCAIGNTVPMPIPTEECFANNKLTFVSDELYGAPRDANYPERAYLAPASKATWTNGENGNQPVVGAQYKLKLQLPYGVAGEVVLLQWYYLTANSCKHPGYETYPFPEEWGKDVANYKDLPDCDHIPEDGNGVPEQFWNCAEIEVIKSDGPREDFTYEVTNVPDVAAKVDFEQDIAETAVDNTEYETDYETTDAETLATPVIPYEPCANPHSTYYEANADCTGYHVCMSGEPLHYFDCNHDMLYDETKLMCNYANEVNCVVKVEVSDAEQPVIDEDMQDVEEVGDDHAVDVQEEVEPEIQIIPTRPAKPLPSITISTEVPTGYPITPRPTMRPTQQLVSQTPRPTDHPSPRPTPRPSGQPTPRPTRKPSDRPTPLPTRKPSGRPTMEPTPRPTNRPVLTSVIVGDDEDTTFDYLSTTTKKPTRYPTTSRPTPAKFNVLPPSNNVSDQSVTPMPTPKPRRQRTPRPTPKPKPPSYTYSGANPIASSFFGNSNPTSPSVSSILPPSASTPAAKPAANNNPSKGQEQSLGEQINGQIQYHQIKAKKQKLKKQKQKEKKRLQKKRQKRQQLKKQKKREDG